MKKPGQSLVEVVLAVAILAFVTVTAAALATRATRSSAESGRRTQASALATKEFEALRTFRDTRLKQNLEWDDFMPPLSPVTGCATFVMEQQGATWNYVSQTAAQSYNSTVDPTFDPASGSGIYRRLIHMCQAKEFDIDNGMQDSSQVRSVRVVVEWDESDSVTREAELVTLIGNWEQ